MVAALSDRLWSSADYPVSVEGGQKEAVWQCAGFWGRQWYQWQSDRGAIELGLHIFMCQRQMIYKRNRGADDVARLPGKFGRQYGAHSQN